METQKKGYLKIHVAVNITTKEILALEVTDEKVHDCMILNKLVEDISKINPNKKKVKIKFLIIGDGSYHSTENFGFLNEKRIKPIIKLKRNSIISSTNNKSRNKETKQQKDFIKWKKKRDMG